jgi:hypothetical protein
MTSRAIEGDIGIWGLSWAGLCGAVAEKQTWPEVSESVQILSVAGDVI